MIKNIKNRIRRLLDIRVITLKHLSNNIEKEMRRVSQIRYNIETDRFSNKKIWFKICFFLVTVFSSIVSLVLAFLMSFLFNNIFLENSQFPYVFGAFSVFFVLFFLAFNALLDDLIFSKKGKIPDFPVEELKNDFKIFLYPDDTEILDGLIDNLNRDSINNIKEKLKIRSSNVKKELDAIFEKIETQNKVNNREKMIVAWQLGRIPYKDFDVVYDLLKKKN